MPYFIEIRDTIIAADKILWVEYYTKAELEANAGGAHHNFIPPLEAEGRTYVFVEGIVDTQWIPGDARAEFRQLLNPGRVVKR